MTSWCAKTGRSPLARAAPSFRRLQQMDRHCRYYREVSPRGTLSGRKGHSSAFSRMSRLLKTQMTDIRRLPRFSPPGSRCSVMLRHSLFTPSRCLPNEVVIQRPTLGFITTPKLSPYPCRTARVYRILRARNRPPCISHIQPEEDSEVDRCPHEGSAGRMRKCVIGTRSRISPTTTAITAEAMRTWRTGPDSSLIAR